MRQVSIRGVVTIVVAGGLAGLAVAAERRGHVPFPAIDLLTGYAVVLCGWVGANRRDSRAAGALLLAAGATWFVATAELGDALTGELTFVHRALVVHAVLVASGRGWPIARSAAAGLAYVASVDAARAFSTAWLVAVAGAATVVLVVDGRRTRGAGPFVVAALGGIATWTAALAWLRPHEILGPAQRSAVYGLGLALAAGAVAARTALIRSPTPATVDVVRDGGTGDVRVGFRDGPGEPFRDVTGAAIDLPDPAGALIVVTDSGGETAIVHPGAVDARGVVREGLLDAARLLRAHRDALVAQRSLAREIADSERRIRLADEVAGAEVAFDLQRCVVPVLDRAGDRLVGDTSVAAAQAREALGSIAAELRAIADGLTPADLARGFTPAVHALAARTRVPVDVAVGPIALDPHVAAGLYFVVAEAVTNAVRHANPTEIDVRLVADVAGLRLTVADDGAGGARLADGGGLSGLRQRLLALGGTLAVDTRAGGGTVVTACLPPPVVSRPG